LASESSRFDAESASQGSRMCPGGIRPDDPAPAIPHGYETLGFLVSLLCSQIELNAKLTGLCVEASIAELDRRRSR
jgi:hypothetical protein